MSALSSYTLREWRTLFDAQSMKCNMNYCRMTQHLLCSLFMHSYFGNAYCVSEEKDIVVLD